MKHREYSWPYGNEVGQEEIIRSDVLVLGGGLSGCFAAIAAARKGFSVVVVEKGAAEKSGAAGTGFDHWESACTNPCSEVTPEEIASVELATGAPESLQQETAEGLTLESTLGTDSPEDRMVEHIALREAIDQLPEREKMTILLRFFTGLTQEQTARILGVSQVQISRLERRGLADLRQLLDG